MTTAGKKWVRPQNTPLAGVCGAIANALGVSAAIIRVIWLVALLIYGTGFFFYLVAWSFLPREDHQFDPDKPLFLGVCMRLAKKLDLEVSLVRMATFFSFFLSCGLTVLGYFVCYFLLPSEAVGE